MFTSKKSRRVLVLATAVVGSLVASILPASAENAAPKGDLVLVRNQDFATFNPDLAQNDSIFPQQQIYEPLYMISQDGKTVSPWLAKSSSQAADKLTWTQVSDLKGWGNDAGKLFGITSIPQNLLLDKEGKIIDKNLRGADLDAKLEEIIK